MAIKVSYEIQNRMLPLNPYIRNFKMPEMFPQEHFGFCLIIPQLLC